MNNSSVCWENNELCFYVPYFGCDKKDQWYTNRADYHLEQIERLCDINQPFCFTEIRKDFLKSI